MGPKAVSQEDKELLGIETRALKRAKTINREVLGQWQYGVCGCV